MGVEVKGRTQRLACVEGGTCSGGVCGEVCRERGMQRQSIGTVARQEVWQGAGCPGAQAWSQ